MLSPTFSSVLPENLEEGQETELAGASPWTGQHGAISRQVS